MAPHAEDASAMPGRLTFPKLPSSWMPTCGMAKKTARHHHINQGHFSPALMRPPCLQRELTAITDDCLAEVLLVHDSPQHVRAHHSGVCPPAHQHSLSQAAMEQFPEMAFTRHHSSKPAAQASEQAAHLGGSMAEASLHTSPQSATGH